MTMVQELFACTVAPARVTFPAVTVSVPGGVQVLLTGVVVATRPEGSGSLKPTPVRSDATFKFLIKKVIVVVEPLAIGVEPNVLVISGGVTAIAPRSSR